MAIRPSQPENDQAREARERSAVSQAVMLGMNLATGMAFFAGLGYYLDYRRGVGGWAWTVSGTGLGLLYGAYEVYRVTRALAPPPDAPPNDRRDNALSSGPHA
jgi:F0F1-type ATP synthase assembly protein I